MSIPEPYTDDPRVTARSRGGFTVQLTDTHVHILFSTLHAWTICWGPDLDFVERADGLGLHIGYVTAVDAIAAVLPQPIHA